MVAEQTSVFNRLDSLRGDRSKRKQNKYCRYHRDIGHTTEKCITLKDEIEKLIRRGYLQDNIIGRRAKPQNDQLEVEPLREIRTIFGGPHFTGETRGARDRCALKAKGRPLNNVDNLDKQPIKNFKWENDNITFSYRDARHVHHPHCDTLVIAAQVANNNVYRILVDNGSPVDILYYQAFERMDLKISDLKLSLNLVYGFTGDSVTPMGIISLPMTLGEYPRQS